MPLVIVASQDLTLGAAFLGSAAEHASFATAHNGVCLCVATGAEPTTVALVADQVHAGASPDLACRQALAKLGEGVLQVLVVDTHGRTGAGTTGGGWPHFGHSRGTDHACAGWALDSLASLSAMALSFERSAGTSLDERLWLALSSGDRASGLSWTHAEILVVPPGQKPRRELSESITPLNHLRRMLTEGSPPAT